MLTIGLMSPKHSSNVGGVLRAATCYNASMVAVQGHRYRRNGTDTPKTYRHIPLLQVSNLKEVIPFNCVPIAVDLVPEATSIVEFEHPKNAFYVFGPEDGTLGSQVLSWCRHTIFVPTSQCMNLACCVNVVLYDRLLKCTTKQFI